MANAPDDLGSVTLGSPSRVRLELSPTPPLDYAAPGEQATNARLLVEAVRVAADATACAVLTFEPDRDVLRVTCAMPRRFDRPLEHPASGSCAIVSAWLGNPEDRAPQPADARCSTCTEQFGAPPLFAVRVPRSGHRPLVVAAFSPKSAPGPRRLQAVKRLARQLGGIIEPAADPHAERRAARDLRRRARELAALHQLAASLSSAASPDDLVTTILDGARHVMSCDSAAIYLAEEASGRMSSFAIRGFTVEERQWLDGHAASYLDLQNRPTLGSLLADVQATPAVAAGPAGARLQSVLTFDGILCTPLSLYGKIVGVLFLGVRRPGALSTEDYHLAAAIADYAAIAIANARLVQSHASNIRNLSTISRVGQAVAESLQSQLILQEIARGAAEALAPSSTTVSLLDEERAEIVVAAVHLASPEEDFIRRIPLRNSWVGRVVEYGEPVIMSLPDVPLSVVATRFGIASMVGVPIVMQGKVIGALTAYSKSHQQYQQSDVELLQALAAQAAVAIEQSNLHQSIMREQAKLEAIVESLEEGLVLVDEDGNIAYANRRCGDLLGEHPPGQPWRTIGGLWSQLVQHAAAPDDVQARLATLDGSSSTEITLRLAQPVRRDLSIRSLTVEADGISVGRGYILRDVTRQVEVERIKASILATVSHELRTPLAAIKGFASALLRDDMRWSRASQRDFITQIEREADRLTGLVRNLLDMSRLEAGTVQFEWEPCDLADLVRDLLSRSEALVPDHAVSLLVDTTEPECVVDRRFLERVIWNLVENAAKYSPAGSPIVVRIARDDSGVLISVADRGIGIDPSERERIFERFVRGAGVGKTGGTGLGLAICRAIVEVHGGAIAIDSEPNHGSTFTVSLPDRAPSGPVA
jgi:signal transduction histidine kinase